MIRIGDPGSKNQNLISAIDKIELSVRQATGGVVSLLLAELSDSQSLLDIGESLRVNAEFAKTVCRSYKTLDLNQFENYPDYLADICDPSLLDSLSDRFDFVACFSLLEHTYQPFTACQNLIGLVNKGGKIFGSAPFLYPRHSPSNLSYQDYFRFTRDAYAVLFPNVERIELYPMRGRLATSLLILTSRYKTFAERKYPKLTQWVNSRFLNGEQLLQTSGYEFVVTV
jgi:hypothetical protein